jgi:hypothetical protein
MNGKRSGSDRDASLPRERWRDRLGKKLGFQPDSLRSTSLPNRSSNTSHRAYPPSKNGFDVRSVQVEPIKSVQTIAASSAPVAPKAQAGGNSATYEQTTDAQKQDKLQEKDEGRSVAEGTAGGSKEQVDEPKEENGSVDTDEVAGRTREPDDFWALADEKLRRDSDKSKIMENFDRVLQKPENIGPALEPPRTEARRKQIDAFIESKIKKLESAEDQNRLSQHKKKAKRFLRTAVECVKATQGIVKAATATCLPASVACAGVTILLTVSLAIQCHR